MRKCTAEIYCPKVKNDTACCADCKHREGCKDACEYRGYADSCGLMEVEE